MKTAENSGTEPLSTEEKEINLSDYRTGDLSNIPPELVLAIIRKFESEIR